jgi:hypothetical protein
MGRALKIQKNNVGAGTSVAGSDPVVTTYNQTVLADAGFPNFGSLTNPAFNTPVQTLDNTQFLGVVGGSPATSTASATFPEVAALVNILLVDGTASETVTGSYTGRLIRQKGSHKFLVAATGATIADEDMLVGQAYQIASLGSTNWQAVVHQQVQPLATYLLPQRLAQVQVQFMQLVNACCQTQPPLPQVT